MACPFVNLEAIAADLDDVSGEVSVDEGLDDLRLVNALPDGGGAVVSGGPGAGTTDVRTREGAGDFAASLGDAHRSISVSESMSGGHPGDIPRKPPMLIVAESECPGAEDAP